MARRVSTTVECEKIIATNPEKATENIRKKALQWGDTPFTPVNLELKFTEPRLIPAAILGELKRQLVEKLETALIADHQQNRPERLVLSPSMRGCPQGGGVNPDAIPDHLMTCHHCIRHANGLCPRETGRPAPDLYLRNGASTFPLEFDCKNCLMFIQKKILSLQPDK